MRARTADKTPSQAPQEKLSQIERLRVISCHYETSCCFTLCCSFVFAAPKPEPVYQDAVLKSFRMVNDGEHCSTSGSASPDYAGGASTSTSTNCTATQSAYYTVSIGDQIIVLTPAVTVPKVAPAAATRGFNRFFSKDSVFIWSSSRNARENKARLSGEILCSRWQARIAV